MMNDDQGMLFMLEININILFTEIRLSESFVKPDQLYHDRMNFLIISIQIVEKFSILLTSFSRFSYELMKIF